MGGGLAASAVRRLAQASRSGASSKGGGGGGGGGRPTTDQFWAVEGRILRVKSDHRTQSLLNVVAAEPPAENLNLSRKQKVTSRLQRVAATHVARSQRGQEDFWKVYLAKYQSVRDEWENLFWDEVPEEEIVKVPVNKNDPFTILGLERRDRPYSPVEIKAAYREKALKYHPDHNPGKDAEVRFEKIWNAYKMLQHRRSWRR